MFEFFVLLFLQINKLKHNCGERIKAIKWRTKANYGYIKKREFITFYIMFWRDKTIKVKCDFRDNID